MKIFFPLVLALLFVSFNLQGGATQSSGSSLEFYPNPAAQNELVMIELNSSTANTDIFFLDRSGGWIKVNPAMKTDCQRLNMASNRRSRFANYICFQIPKNLLGGTQKFKVTDVGEDELEILGYSTTCRNPSSGAVITRNCFYDPNNGDEKLNTSNDYIWQRSQIMIFHENQLPDNVAGWINTYFMGKGYKNSQEISLTSKISLYGIKLAKICNGYISIYELNTSPGEARQKLDEAFTNYIVPGSKKSIRDNYLVRYLDPVPSYGQPNGNLELAVKVFQTGYNLKNIINLPPNFYANNQHIGILDSGFNNTSFPFSSPKSFIEIGYLDNGKSLHGTLVAEIIRQIIADTKNTIGTTHITPVKVCKDGTCPLEAVIQGVCHAADVGAETINMSFGGDTDSKIMKYLITEKLKSVNYVASAGNRQEKLYDMNGQSNCKVNNSGHCGVYQQFPAKNRPCYWSWFCKPTRYSFQF